MKFLIPLMVLILVAGCSTPQTRARSNPELMESLSAEERALLEAGEIELGFTEEMVRVALGKPDRKYSERTEEGETVIWAYHVGNLMSGFSVGVGTSIGGSRRGTGVGAGVGVGTGGRLRAEEKMRVAFEGGRVVGIERAER